MQQPNCNPFLPTMMSSPRALRIVTSRRVPAYRHFMRGYPLATVDLLGCLGSDPANISEFSCLPFSWSVWINLASAAHVVPDSRSHPQQLHYFTISIPSIYYG